MKQNFEYPLAFLFGATLYAILEIMFRGFTHWTMFFAGGICYISLYHFFTFNNNLPLWKNCLAGALIITGIEFVFGFVFNIMLGWRVWDYSRYPLDILGQICLPYTLLWLILSAPIVWIAKRMRSYYKYT